MVLLPILFQYRLPFWRHDRLWLFFYASFLVIVMIDPVWSPACCALRDSVRISPYKPHLFHFTRFTFHGFSSSRQFAFTFPNRLAHRLPLVRRWAQAGR